MVISAMKMNYHKKKEFLFLGDQDPMVQLKWAHLTEQGIKAMNFKQYTFKEYKNMGHSSCDQVKSLSRNILNDILLLFRKCKM